jgi:2,4-dienoyl-CoA reductase-like NADH-dependent reductase (Old Yellow Enzyme family)
MRSRTFHYRSTEDLKQAIRSEGLEIPWSTDLSILGSKINVQGHTLPNAMAVHPMEGQDACEDGSPSELTTRRYMRFSAGGAGLIWFEAVAVVPEGKANPHQLRITPENLDSFKTIRSQILETAHDRLGRWHTPLVIMQLTHSGRFCNPGTRKPIIACHNPFLNKRMKLSEDYPVVTDEQLEKLEDAYVRAAKLAREAGFHGIDIKACHRYLVSELLSAHTRPGRYGGSFLGRTRFLLNIIDKVQAAVGKDFIIATRLNLYDGIPYPYGWGVNREDHTLYDLDEPLELVGILKEKGVRLINATMGTPYYNPHVNRPFDKGEYSPEEHPLVGVSRLLNGAGVIQRAYPGMVIVGTGYSWLRQFAPYVAAGTLKSGQAKIIGFGRAAFAYPDFADDIIQKSEMDSRKCCITCGRCTELMRAQATTGCVIHDREQYAPIYRQYCMKR